MSPRRIGPTRRHADNWPEIFRAFTDATRAERGCLWFDWSRSLDDPTGYVLVEVPGTEGSELGELRVSR
ncbi:MAG: antibiotic biosynthesis monooxygenase [Blastococcus sp.]|jgi:quinol monooxygenase YgiN|nr:antibiotic biosynthesis monooxygenase [Blastococcus sp.]